MEPNEIMQALRKPFKVSEIEWRVGRAGKTQSGMWVFPLAYVTNRAIQSRLDETVGIERWQNKYDKGPDGGVVCGISIRFDDQWVTKWDGAENTDFEAIKGGLSGAMKRAAAQWGIGRYLYYLESAYGKVHENGRLKASAKIDGQYTKFKYDPPELPKWALPKEVNNGI